MKGFASALTAALLMVACGGSGQAPRDIAPEAAVGTMALSVSGSAATAGFVFDIATPDGHVVASQFVAKPTAPAAGLTDAFFTLAAGSYVATATPMISQQAPEPGCTPATATVTVTAAQTTEAVLVARCQANRGGLDVGARTNDAPAFTDVAYAPSRYVAPCAPVTVTVTAADADGDALTYKWQVISGPTAGLSFTSADNHATLSSTAAGDFQIEVQACDALGCSKLDLPVHVVGTAGASCGVSCDDANPCTTDGRDASGACTHTVVADGPQCTGGKLHVKLLGFNDFHGQLDEGRKVSNRPVGGAAVMATYLETAQAGLEDQTILVHAGDQVGASPPSSALLQDEPSISFLNLLANSACSYTNKMDPACNIVGTLGNHEFDEGKAELMRLLTGGNYPKGPFLENPYKGARFPYVSANVVDAVTGQPILPPYVIKRIKGVPIAFIGAVLKDTPTIVTPTGVAGLKFLDEADAINAYVPELKAMGVHAIVVNIHQGGSQTSYTGPTKSGGTIAGPEINDIVQRLDDEVDVVVSGHTHAFSNAFITKPSGAQVLVTQAFSASTAYDDIDLLIDPVSGQVTAKTAQVVTTYSDVAPGTTRDPAVNAIVTAAQTLVGPLVNQLIGNATTAFTQSQNTAGESTMGDLIADAQRANTGTDFAFMNPGGIRADLAAGPITWGALFTIQPFGNSLVTMKMTGAQIYAVLEQQWAGQSFPKIMQISGFDYTWDPAKPVGARVVQVRKASVPIDLTATYTVTCNNFMAAGGDGYTEFTLGTDQVGGAIDLDALVDYVEAHTPIAGALDGRIKTP